MVDDKRPRLYTNIEAPYGHVEVTVQGAEGESTEDLGEVFDEKLTDAVEAQKELAGEDDDKVGVE